MNALVLLLDDDELDAVANVAQLRGICIAEMLRELLRLPPRPSSLDRLGERAPAVEARPALALVPDERLRAPAHLRSYPSRALGTR